MKTEKQVMDIYMELDFRYHDEGLSVEEDNEIRIKLDLLDFILENE